MFENVERKNAVEKFRYETEGNARHRRRQCDERSYARTRCNSCIASRSRQRRCLRQTFCLREESFRTQRRVDCSCVRREQSARAPAKRGPFDRASQKSLHNFRTLADRAPNEERDGIEGRPESKLVVGSSLEVRRLAFAQYQSFGDDPARPKAPCFCRSPFKPDRGCELPNHLHPWSWRRRGAKSCGLM